MNVKEQLLFFWNFLKENRKIRIDFFLFLGILVITPTQNYYAKLKIPEGRPLVRDIALNFGEIKEYPVNFAGQPTPWLSAEAALVTDLNSKVIIFAKNPDTQLIPASTTKIMTALISLEQYSLDQILEVKQAYPIGMVMELEQGEKMTVSNLLKAMLVGSANDAAMVLAENYPGGLEKFIERMNQKAKELYLDKTVFKNPTGVEDEGHITTAHDLLVLTGEAIKNDTFREIVSIKKTTVWDITGENEYEFENINELLNVVPGLKGIKTGWTENAGECFISWIERDEHNILTVVLGSQDRFGETQKLVEWVFANFRWESIAETIPD